MNKNDVMKALERCASFADCGDCPYHGMNLCDHHLCEDALVLLQSTDNKHNVTGCGITFCDAPTYHTAIIYTKHDNLLKWFDVNVTRCDTDDYRRLRDHFAQDREVQLILLVRHEDIRIGDTIKSKCICRIKCPINPLPIRGEFECVSTGEMTKLLASIGWKYKRKVHSSMFE